MIEAVEFDSSRVEGFSDGGRAEGRRPGTMLTAATTRLRWLYLGQYATVMDAEEAGIMLAWETADRVALDSQGAIARVTQLRYSRA